MSKTSPPLKKWVLTLLIIVGLIVSIVYLVKDSRTLDIEAANLSVDEELAIQISQRYLAGGWAQRLDSTPYAAKYVKETSSVFKVYIIDEGDTSTCKGYQVIVNKQSGNVLKNSNVNFCEEDGFQYQFQLTSLENMDNFTVGGQIINDPMESNDFWEWTIDFKYTGPTPIKRVAYDVIEFDKSKAINQTFEYGETFQIQGDLSNEAKTLTIKVNWIENGEVQQGKVIYDITRISEPGKNRNTD